MLLMRLLKGFSKKHCFWVSQAFSLTSFFQLEGDKCLSCNPVYLKRCAKYLFLEHGRIKQQEIVFSWYLDSKALSRIFLVPHPIFAQPTSVWFFLLKICLSVVFLLSFLSRPLISQTNHLFHNSNSQLFFYIPVLACDKLCVRIKALFSLLKKYT